MRNISKQTLECADQALKWPLRMMRLTGVLGVILFVALLHKPIQALSADLLSTNRVILAWDRSPSSGVTGYRIYYGAGSGNYTNSVPVGNVTTNTISGLTGGVRYFFAVTAYDANGVESSFSNEINFVPGSPTVRVRMAANRQAILTVAGQAGHTYSIQATSDLKTWTVIGTVTHGSGSSVEFTDTNAASFPRRFYRARDTLP